MAEADVLAAIVALHAHIDTLFDGTGVVSLKSLSVVNSTGDAVVLGSSGSNGRGAYIYGNGSGSGLHAVGGATGHGIFGIGGATSGSGIYGIGPNGSGIRATAGANFPGLALYGGGLGAGLQATGGATGPGLQATGGATSGHGIVATTTVGDAIRAVASGTVSRGIAAVGVGSGAGIFAGGGVTGEGIRAQGGATSGAGLTAMVSPGGLGDGFLAVGAGEGKADINGDILGGLTGDVSGSVGSVASYGSLIADIEAALVAEGDATALLQAIADKIAGDFVVGDVSSAAIAAAVRVNLATELARIDEDVSAAKILTTAYDAAKTAAQDGDTMVPSVLPATPTNVTDAQAAIIAAVPGAVPVGWVRITQDTLDPDDEPLGPIGPGAIVTAYVKADEATTVGPSTPATSVGAWYLDLPPDALWILRAQGADYDHDNPEVQT